VSDAQVEELIIQTLGLIARGERLEPSQFGRPPDSYPLVAQFGERFVFDKEPAFLYK
jgi:hypothetical protein